MSRYVLTREARNDLKQIRDYVLDEDGFRAARYVVAALVNGFRALARTPGQGHRREDLTKRDELRFWAVFSYLIVYRIDRKPLTIVAILHASAMSNEYCVSASRTGHSLAENPLWISEVLYYDIAVCETATAMRALENAASGACGRLHRRVGRALQTE